jgi:hypothetical protein
MRTTLCLLFLFIAGSAGAAQHAASGDAGFSGSWTIDRQASSAIDPWRRIHLDIAVDGKEVTIDRKVTTGRRTSEESYPLRIGKTVRVPVEWWTGNRHIGAYMGGDGKKAMTAQWLDNKRTLRVTADYILETSQGENPVRTYTEYRLSPDGHTLRVIQLRSSRNLPSVHVFNRD